MKVAKKYSHLNGEEWLLVHKKAAYQEILDVIADIDAEKCRTRTSKEKDKKGRAPYSPVAISTEIDERFSSLGWQSTRYSYHSAHGLEQREGMSQMTLEEQRQYLRSQGAEAIYLYNETSFIAVEAQFGERALVGYDIFVRHLALYIRRIINVGIEILPTKVMQKGMSSGSAYYEGELHNILRHDRGNPSVPLVIIGLEP